MHPIITSFSDANHSVGENPEVKGGIQYNYEYLENHFKFMRIQLFTIALFVLHIFERIFITIFFNIFMTYS